MQTLIHRPYSMKWQKYADDILPMWVADMDFQAPSAVQTALVQWAQQGDMGYELPRAQATQAVQDWLAKRHGLNVVADTIVWQAGVVAGFNAALASVCQPGDQVIVPYPTYPPMRQAPANHGASAVELPITFAGGHWQVDLDALARIASDARTKALLISHPMNPQGQGYRQEQLARMVAICQRHQVLLISDEIHADLLLSQPDHQSLLHWQDELEQLVVLMAASKTFNIAGLATSYMLCPNKALRRQIRQATRGLDSHANVAGIVATQAAYQQGEAWLNELLAQLSSNQQVIEDWLGAYPQITYHGTPATYLAWMDWRGLSSTPYQDVLAHGVACSDGQPFGTPGWLRLNFACHPDRLQQALSRMAQAIEAY